MVDPQPEVVFYFDVLGFSAMARNSGAQVQNVLGDLAAVLNEPRMATQSDAWQHQYALSDSVFLTHSSPSEAVRLAADLVFNLFQVSRPDKGEEAAPILIRGGLALGEVSHLPGLFNDAESNQGNLVGTAVLDAVGLEASGLQGPRILLSEDLVESLEQEPTEPHPGDWLRATEVHGIWEILWPLPAYSGGSQQALSEVAEVTEEALRLMTLHGGHPTYGGHYRELALLVARAIERLARRCKSKPKGEQQLEEVAKLLPRAEVNRTLDEISGLPPLFDLQFRNLIDRIERIASDTVSIS